MLILNTTRSNIGLEDEARPHPTEARGVCVFSAQLCLQRLAGESISEATSEEENDGPT